MWELIDITSQILGILSFIPIAFSAYVLFHFYRTKKAELVRIRTEPGERPGILIVDSIRPGGQSIQGQVENWLWSQTEFKNKEEMLSIETAEFRGDLDPKSMDEVVQGIRAAVGKLQTKGVTKYHVFIRGPMVLAAATGGVLYNHRPAVFYQQGNEGGYVCWGSINR